MRPNPGPRDRALHGVLPSDGPGNGCVKPSVLKLPEPRLAVLQFCGLAKPLSPKGPVSIENLREL